MKFSKAATGYGQTLCTMVYQLMTEKEHFEQHFFDRFIKAYPDLSDGKITKSESPDFLIEYGGDTVGVEISKIVNEKNPGDNFSPSERNAVEQKISQRALKVFLHKYNIPLHVDFAFHDSIDVTKGKEELLADKLAQLVSDHVVRHELTRHFHLQIDRGLPRELMHCGIAFFPGITDSIWYSAKGQMVPNLNKDYLLRIIRRKEVKVDEYKRRADSLILLLIEGVVPDSWFDKIELIARDELNTRFDKILIFRNLSDEVVTVK